MHFFLFFLQFRFFVGESRRLLYSVTFLFFFAYVRLIASIIRPFWTGVSFITFQSDETLSQTPV